MNNLSLFDSANEINNVFGECVKFSSFIPAIFINRELLKSKKVLIAPFYWKGWTIEI